MFDYLEYVTVEGEDRNHDVEVYALSTCGFCKRALAFMEKNKIAYRYVYVDKVPLELKNRAKTELKEKFNEHVAFPFAVIDGSTSLVGFIEPDWKKTLLGE